MLQKIKGLHLHSWAIAYLSIVVIAAIIVAIFFRGQQYSIDQVAVVIVTPILLTILFVRLMGRLIVVHEVSKAEEKQFKERREKMEKGEKMSNWVGIPLFIILLLGVLAFYVASILAVSSGIYLFFGLNSISKLVWLKICIPSFIAAPCLILLFLLIMAIYSFWPYRDRISSIISKGFAEFKGEDKGNDIHLNGIRIPVNLPRFLL